MRFLLVMHNYFADPNTGAMHALRTTMKWLAQAGHDCRVLCTARFDTANVLEISSHLQSLGITATSMAAPGRLARTGGAGREVSGRPWLRFAMFPELARPVQVELLQTRHNDASRPDRVEGEQFLDRLRAILTDPGLCPQLLIAYGRHAVVPRALQMAQERGLTTLVGLHNEGFELPDYFAYAHHVMTCSPYLSNLYRVRMGVASTPLVPALDWSQIVAPRENRVMVSFVNPSLAKGAGLIARLAAMLGRMRPDIPLMIVQSSGSAAFFNSVPDVDFSLYPSILAAPAVSYPRDYLALTRILLAPSTWHEAFGRVAAEAMINGIPPLVSPRGALPQVVGGDFFDGGGGLVLPLPDWLDAQCTTVVNEQEARPWLNAVTRLWDDPAFYAAVSRRASDLAEQLYSEPVLKRAYLDYFTTREPTAGVLVGEED